LLKVSHDGLRKEKNPRLKKTVERGGRGNQETPQLRGEAWFTMSLGLNNMGKMQRPKNSERVKYGEPIGGDNPLRVGFSK